VSHSFNWAIRRNVLSILLVDSGPVYPEYIREKIARVFDAEGPYFVRQLLAPTARITLDALLVRQGYGPEVNALQAIDQE
jgi:hypothetical protein